ncbi:MAG: hypothetical protein C0622_03525 [Desulfuromonas sp.]|nr:MAG: hypothetical protein C0622_03525 [Desulfuromonas sp.]
MSSSPTYSISNGIVILYEDISPTGRAFYALLLILLGALALRIHTHNDTTLIIRTVSWIVLIPMLSWCLYLASWRKQIKFDLNTHKLHISSGPVVFLFNTSKDLARFNKVLVKTRQDHTTSVDNAPGSKTANKITKRFYLVGTEQIHIATRCYSKKDRSRENAVVKLEKSLREIIEH